MTMKIVAEEAIDYGRFLKRLKLARDDFTRWIKEIAAYDNFKAGAAAFTGRVTSLMSLFPAYKRKSPGPGQDSSHLDND